MSELDILKNLQLSWTSLKVHDKEVFYEKANLQTIVAYDVWDVEIPTLETASIHLFEVEKPASEEEWTKWLKQDDRSIWDVEFEFNYKQTDTGSALRAQFDSFDQFTMVLTKNRSKEYWILANYDDIENKGFTVLGAISTDNLNMNEAFPYLMALFHLNYYNLSTAAKGGDEDFMEAINYCEIIDGISGDSEEQARILATELYERVKDDEAFWKEF